MGFEGSFQQPRKLSLDEILEQLDASKSNLEAVIPREQEFTIGHTTIAVRCSADFESFTFRHNGVLVEAEIKDENIGHVEVIDADSGKSIDDITTYQNMKSICTEIASRIKPSTPDKSLQ